MSNGYWVRNHDDSCLIRQWDLATSEDCTCAAQPEWVEKTQAYRLIKDGRTWDYSNLMADMEDWTRKILREEPDAVVSVQETSRAEMDAWRSC